MICNVLSFEFFLFSSRLVISYSSFRIKGQFPPLPLSLSLIDTLSTPLAHSFFPPSVPPLPKENRIQIVVNAQLLKLARKLVECSSISWSLNKTTTLYIPSQDSFLYSFDDLIIHALLLIGNKLDL